MNVPEAVGVPLMVIVLDAQEADTPAGKSVAVPMPVAPVVVCVMAVKAVLMQSVGVEEGEPAVLLGIIVTVNAIPLLSHPGAFLTVNVPL